MKPLIHLPNTNYINKKIIWITGLPRSGTTILGKLIGSCKNVEYIYEPDALLPIFFLKNKISFNNWKMLFEGYFYLDLIRNFLNFRRVNLNKNDDSYYFNYKENNFKFNLQPFDIFKKNKNIPRSKIIIKLPNVLEELLNLNKIYKYFKIISVERNSFEVVDSIIRKKWFKNNTIPRYFPVVEQNSKIYPTWLKKKFYKSWNTFNEYEKATFYVLNQKKFSKKNKSVFKINYEDITTDPKKVVDMIAKKFNLKITKKTLNIIKKIKKKKHKKIFLERKISKNLINKLKK
ncbi:sulfotransferase [Pelagibacteraceae bacterium]|nr:sulfotransferase [Pelagibacteraceae bacterium]